MQTACPKLNVPNAPRLLRPQPSYIKRCKHRTAQNSRQGGLHSRASPHRAIKSFSQKALPEGLPAVDWTRYHLQVLFVDRTDTVRARVAAGLFERIAEWNGFGRALYPWACGVHASQSEAADMTTTASLMGQAKLLGIRSKLFAVPAEQLTLEDLDRHDIIVALDHEVRRDIISMTQSEWHTYYEDKVSVLNQFSQCCGGNILRTGGSALLERELSSIVRPVVQKNRKDSRGSRQSGGGQQIQIPDVLRPSLSKGPEEWNAMVQAMIISCAGLVQYLIDAYPADLPHYDPL